MWLLQKKIVTRFSDNVRSISMVNRKNIPFEWTEECQHSFKILKKR